MRTAATDNLSIYRDLRAAGHDIRHMRFERHLETARPRESDSDRLDQSPKAGTRPIDWERTSVFSHRVGAATGRSPFRYFLDGAQRTLPSFFTDVVPISSSINVAGILERDDEGAAKLAANTLKLQHTWLIPKRSSFPVVNAVLERLCAMGDCNIVDPLERFKDEPDQYAEALANYDRIAEFAKSAASAIRQKIEYDLFDEWSKANSAERDWIVIDGMLRHGTARAIGLVKSFTESYLSGSDYEELYRLKPGYRSSAFSIQRHGLELVTWYLRLWDPTGRDPRYSLIRIETADIDLGAADAGDRIDHLSAWVLAERIPSAKADERWATLLYPVHHLERILKRRLDIETRSWWQG